MLNTGMAICGEQSGWYSSVWRGWAANNSFTDLHPVVPENFNRVVVQPLFRLIPAMRILHLDAKKGWNGGSAIHMRVKRSTLSSPVSPLGRESEEGRSAVRAEMRPQDEPCSGRVVEGTSQEVCGQESKRRVGARGDGLDRIDEHDITRSRDTHLVGIAGCGSTHCAVDRSATYGVPFC